MMKRFSVAKWLACGLLMVVLSVGCSLYRNDRMYVPPEKYTLARTFFMQTGSLDLTERHLTDLQWRRGEINETLYRLHKEFEVLPEELPAQK